MGAACMLIMGKGEAKNKVKKTEICVPMSKGYCVCYRTCRFLVNLLSKEN